MFKEKILKNKICILYTTIIFILSIVLKDIDLGVLGIYFLLLVLSYNWLKKNFLTVWTYVVILIFCQFFVLDNLIPFIFKLSDGTITLMKFWKEIIILQSIYILIKNTDTKERMKKYIKNNKILLCFLLSIIIFIFSMIITIPKVDSLFIAIYGIRNYIIGYLILLIFMLNKFHLQDIYKFIDKIAVAFVYLSIWGIFQAVFLGDKFLIKIGYGLNGVLSSSYYLSGYFGRQRVVSTFASPNTFGLIAAMILMYFVYKIYNEFKNNKVKLVDVIYFIVVFIALMLSYSRSAYLSFAIGFIIFVFMELNKKLKIIFSISIIFVSVVVIILSFILVDKVDNMFINHIFRTITLRDTSAIGHIDSTNYALEVMKSNPFGIGVGRSGQKSLQFIDSALHAENSYFIIAFDMGIIGLIIYLISLGFLGYELIKIYASQKQGISMVISKLSFVIFLEIYLSYMFLPTIQELEVAYLFFPILGLTWSIYNEKIEKSDYNE